MAKQVTAYQADDGSLHPTESGAEKVNAQLRYAQLRYRLSDLFADVWDNVDDEDDVDYLALSGYNSSEAWIKHMVDLVVDPADLARLRIVARHLETISKLVKEAE